jgi:hypothetical protein
MAKGDQLWVWQERTSDGWATIAAGVSHKLSEVPVVRALVTRTFDIADTKFRGYAETRRQVTGNTIRLVRFEVGSILEVHADPGHLTTDERRKRL